jgi:hypothetical protein
MTENWTSAVSTAKDEVTTLKTDEVATLYM